MDKYSHLKSKYKNLFIDLDGTVLNSFTGIKNGIDYMLKKTNSSYIVEDYNEFIGPPISESFLRIYKEDELENAIKLYRDYYFSKGIFECELYDGIKEVLNNLKNVGYMLYVCTTKEISSAKTVLKNHGIFGCFKDIFATVEPTLREKEDIMADGIRRYNLKAEEILMIGDTKYDVRAAHFCGVDVMLCTYGFDDYSRSFGDVVAYASSPYEISQILQ